MAPENWRLLSCVGKVLEEPGTEALWAQFYDCTELRGESLDTLAHVVSHYSVLLFLIFLYFQ